ncbi:MAG: septal ring lytic transglycosylase RlpA family protein [Beijerinckiaceae bacterium]|nr:septal ring lytic transglycosylase RlpA family protein [Beijerinckiaceae bacterium]
MLVSLRARAGRAPSGVIAACIGAAAAFLGGCAQDPANTAPRARTSEYFPSSVYGAASPRVVADGQSVPRGGGQRLVGRPYTVAGKRYIPREVTPGYTITGNASWYGSAFHGRRTANGEVYDMRALSAAHPTMPLPSYARVTNMRNGHSIIVRVNDRGPFHAGRVLDVSQRVAETLDFKRSGTGRVKVDFVGPAGLAGSDDAILIASLRTDGRPATIDGPTTAPTTMIAQAPPAQPARAPEPAPQAVASVAAQPETTTVAASAPTPPSRSAPAGQGFGQPALQPIPAISPQTASGSGAITTAMTFPAYAPLPPPRPLDLQTIPGADTPIGATRRRAAQPMFFAEPSPVASTLIARKPFEGVDMGALLPLR